ncbi:3-oxoacyl-[acyl-carrier-protein] synthase III C-terminal domain-containing protein [Rhodospirillaceae bacterium SYSU D60014]|uniref:type III polyketide synthase n=1 Tax=Virgifigura deserti TaxID=2268457 RepID=UPI000E676513
MNTPRLLSLATAVPPFVLRQQEVMQLSERLFDRRRSEINRLLPVYSHAGIETRYSCVPVEWYFEPHGWRERAQIYVENATALLAEATGRCLKRAGCDPADVTGLVVASTTGIATPSVDALLMERLAMRRDMRRLPIFGLGCAGGVIGLSHAANMARTAGSGKILFLVVELCGLTFRYGDHSNSNIIATALFGDGAAAVLIDSAGNDAAPGVAFGPGGSHTWSDSLDVMGWRIEEDGFGVLFSRDIPTLVHRDLRAATEGFLQAHGLGIDDLDGLVCHPGGAKVIDAIEAAFDLPSDRLAEARSVLRDYGNMSAVTVLFVLERMLRKGMAGRYMMTALGPGFTAGFQLLDIP